MVKELLSSEQKAKGLPLGSFLWGLGPSIQSSSSRNPMTTLSWQFALSCLPLSSVIPAPLGCALPSSASLAGLCLGSKLSSSISERVVFISGLEAPHFQITQSVSQEE